MQEKKTKFIKNKDYKFLVYEKWTPLSDKEQSQLKNNKSSANNNQFYDDDDDEILSIGDLPDPVRTEYQIYQENLHKFAEDNNFWDLHTLFPISLKYLEQIAAQCGVEIISLPVTTPYKTRISIAKLFDSYKVKQSIIEKTEQYVNNNKKLVEDIIYYRDQNINNENIN